MQHDARVRAAWAALGLGLDPDLTEITRAYRRLARDTHPDVSATPDAAARFDALSEAYQVAVQASERQQVAPQRPEPVTHAAPREPATVLTDDGWWGSVRRSDAPLVAGPVRVQPSTTPDAAPGKGDVDDRRGGDR